MTGGQPAEFFGAHKVIRRVALPGGRLRQPVLNVGDQREQVGAVNRWIAEPGPRPVAVRVKAAAATGHDRAFPAGLAQSGQPLLASDDPRVPPDDVQGMAEDVQAGGRRAVVRRFERVNLFIRPIGLDNDQAGWCQTQRFCPVFAARQSGQD